MMKKLLGILSAMPVAAVILLAGACSDSNRIEVSNTTCAFKAAGGTKTIMVATDGGLWNAEFENYQDDHFSISPKEGRLEITALENKTTQTLSVTIRISVGQSSVLIDVVQAPRFVDVDDAFTITPDITGHQVPVMGGTLTFMVDTDLDWDIIADADWCDATADMENGRAIIKIGENRNPESRTATITFRIADDYGKRNIALTQLGMTSDPYFALLGLWDIYCEQWVVYDDDAVPTFSGPGSHQNLMLRESEPYVSFYMTDFFAPTTSAKIFFDGHDYKLTIPLTYSVLSTSSYSYYLLGFSPETGKLDLDELIGVMSDDLQSIKFPYIKDGYSLGYFAVTSTSVMIIPGMMYPADKTVEFRRSAEQPGPVSMAPAFPYAENAERAVANGPVRLPSQMLDKTGIIGNK